MNQKFSERILEIARTIRDEELSLYEIEQAIKHVQLYDNYKVLQLTRDEFLEQRDTLIKFDAYLYEIQPEPWESWDNYFIEKVEDIKTWTKDNSIILNCDNSQCAYNSNHYKLDKLHCQLNNFSIIPGSRLTFRYEV